MPKHSEALKLHSESRTRKPEAGDLRGEAHEVEAAVQARSEAGKGLADGLKHQLDALRDHEGWEEFDGEIEDITSEMQQAADTFHEKIQETHSQVSEVVADIPKGYVGNEKVQIKIDDFDNSRIEDALDAVKDISNEDFHSSELMSSSEVASFEKSFTAELKKGKVDSETLKVARSLFEEISNPYTNKENVAGTMAILSARGLDNDKLDQLADFLRKAAPSLVPSEQDFLNAVNRIGMDNLDEERQEAKTARPKTTDEKFRERLDKEEAKAAAKREKDRAKATEKQEAGEKKKWDKLFDQFEKIANKAKKNPKYAYADNDFLQDIGRMAIAEAILNGEHTQEEIEEAAKKFRPDFMTDFMPSDEQFAEAMIPVSAKDAEARAQQEALADEAAAEFGNKQKAKKEKAEKAQAETRRKAELAEENARLKAEGKAKIEQDAIRIAREKAQYEADKASRKREETERTFKERVDREHKQNTEYNNAKREKAAEKEWKDLLDKVDVAFHRAAAAEMDKGGRGKKTPDDMEVMAAGRRAAAEVMANSSYSFEDFSNALDKYRPESSRSFMPNRNVVENLKKQKAEKAQETQEKKPGLLKRLFGWLGGEK